MELSQIDELVSKYNEGLADPSELKLIEKLIEEGKIDLLQLKELAFLEEQIMNSPNPIPSFHLDEKFNAMVEEEKGKMGGHTVVHQSSVSGWRWQYYAVAATLAIAGFLVGYLLQNKSSDGEVHELTKQVADLKEMMMFSLLEKESATERLKAVSLTSEMPVSSKVTNALFQTLNKDENVNVRLAALEALKPFLKDGKVREGLIRSIAQQESPLMQVALAELMVSLQEKKSVGELRKLLKNDKTPLEVKSKIKESIDVLI